MVEIGFFWIKSMIVVASSVSLAKNTSIPEILNFS